MGGAPTSSSPRAPGDLATPLGGGGGVLLASGPIRKAGGGGGGGGAVRFRPDTKSGEGLGGSCLAEEGKLI